jgi:hypothetical protein
MLLERYQGNFLFMQDKLFNVLDAIQEISQNNHRKGSNFNKCL